MISLPWLRLWWTVYNKQVFNGELTQLPILLVDLEHYGETDGKYISISSRITDPEVAKGTLLHEMIHQFQFSTGKPMEHDGLFDSWAGIIAIKYNMEVR